MTDWRCFMVLAKYNDETDIDPASISGLLKLCGAKLISRTEERCRYNDERKTIESKTIGFIGFIQPTNYGTIDKMLSMTAIQYKLDYMDC